MPLSELTEIVTRIDEVDLRSPEGRGAIAQRIGQLQTMLDRVGATNSAAQLGVAALLLQRTGDGAPSTDEDAKRMVRTLLVAVEQSFHLPTVARAGDTPEAPPSRGKPAQNSRESQQARRTRAAELAVVKDMLLGEVLIHFGVLAPDQICVALELQLDTDQGLGDILVEYGFTSRDEIQRALDYQNMIRSMIAGEPKARTPAEPVAEQPQSVLPAFNRFLGRLRLTTELLLGEVLVLQGTITSKGLERALELQRSSGMLIGEALIQSGAATRADIQRALVTQGRRDRIGKSKRSPRPS